MRVWETSSEAVVARKSWKHDGAKGGRAKRQTVFKRLQEKANSIPKQASVATAETTCPGGYSYNNSLLDKPDFDEANEKTGATTGCDDRDNADFVTNQCQKGAQTDKD